MQLGTAQRKNATRALLLGSGELGKEVAIELQRLGVEVIACDRYAGAPAMHIAHRSHVLDMLDGEALRNVVEQEQPHLIIPEIEAIATETLAELESEGVRVVPNARATQLTMNREGIRRLAAEELGLPTSPYRFVDSQEGLREAVTAVGMPCVIKPVMSSSGKGQSVIRSQADIESAWRYACTGGRASEEGRDGGTRVIVEGFVDFDYEISLLTVSAADGIHFCAPIGHLQQDGDYRQSWQPQTMSASALQKAQQAAGKVVEALGGYGLFGVELFIKGDAIFFNEVSPRPHDTGLVTLVSQSLSQFALHVRAILGQPIGQIDQRGPSASAVILPEGTSDNVSFDNLPQALAVPTSQLRLFGKPELSGRRRLGVALAQGETTELARERAQQCADTVEVKL